MRLVLSAWILVLTVRLWANEGDLFMGRWEGRYRTESSETGPFAAQVIPEGGTAYRLWVRIGERGSRYAIQGVRKQDKVFFQGRFQAGVATDEAAYDLTGEISENCLTGKFESPEGNGTIELGKVRNAAAATQAKPAGAIQLFDGTKLDYWQHLDGSPAAWKIRSDASMEASGPDVVSRQDFAGFRLHVEFLLPLMADARGQQRANSGIVLAGSNEVHILDTFGGDPTKKSCGAIYEVAAPRVEASVPPLEWQVFDITLRAPVFDADGRQAQHAELTVVFNGVTIHERRQLDDFRKSPLQLRSADSAVRFRNIWILPLEETGTRRTQPHVFPPAKAPGEQPH